METYMSHVEHYRYDPEKEILLQNARKLIQSREWSYASHLLREVLNLTPKDPEALQLLGTCFLERKEFSAAKICFQEIYKIHENDVTCWLLGDVCEKMSDYRGAKRYLLKAAILAKDDNPFLFEIFKTLGNIFVREGDWASAEENYNKALRLMPESDVLQVNYGTLELQKTNIDLAKSHFREAIRLNSNNDHAWIGLALICYQLGDFDLAWANLENALDLNINNRTAIQIYCAWKLKEKRPFEAISLLTRYMATNSEDSEISAVLAQFLGLSGKRDFALIEIERSLLLEPNSITAVQIWDALRKMPGDSNEN